MSHFYGTIDIVAGVRQFADVGASGISGVLIGNESGLTVVITMQGANTSRSLYPGTVDWFPLPTNSSFNGQVQIDPTANLNNIASWPGSYVQIDTFGVNEAPQGYYPMGLPRNTNVGNTVNTTGGTASAIQNDNNAVGTTVVESTPQGVGSSTLLEKNDGTVEFGELVAGVVTNYFQGTPGANPVLTLGEASKSVTVRGPLNAGSFDSDGGTFFSNGSGIVSVRQLLLQANGLTAISKFGVYTVGTTGTAFNHNLGTTPDIVIAVIQGTAGGAGALHNVKVDAASYTSTQFTAIADAAGVSFVGIAIKF